MTVEKTLSKKAIKSNLKNNVAASGAAYKSEITDKANDLKTAFSDATETKVGQVAGQINGGIESISSLSTDVTGKLTGGGAVEGVVTDSLTALTDAVNLAGEEKIDKAKAQGIKLSLSWSEPDSDGNVRLEQSSANPAALIDSSINATLSKISGLNVFSGYVQKISGNVMPKGQPSLLEKIKDGVGAFPSVDKLNELTAEANAIADTAAAEIEGAVGDVVGGTLPVNPAATPGDVGKNLAGDLGGISDAQTKLQGLGDDLKGSVSSAVTSVENKITKGIGIDTDKLGNDFSEQTGKLGSIVKDAVLGGVDKKLGELTQGKLGYGLSVKSLLGGSSTGVLQGAVERMSNAGNNRIQELAPTLSAEKRDEILRLTQGTKEERDQAVDEIAKASGKSVDEINASLDDLDTTIAGTVLVENEESAFADPFDMQSSSTDNTADPSTAVYTYVSSVEELEAEFKKVNREVTELVVHWSDTYSNKNIGSEEINKTHIKLGIGRGIGYHYVIRRDGSLQRGRSVNIKGEHSEINGHDEYSIGIVFVGGINAPSGTEFPTSYRSATSITLSQMNTFREFCQAFYNRFPGGQILGHNDIDPEEQDPGFDVRDYVEDLFNKKSLFDDPSSRGPFTPSELITAELPK